MKEIQFSRKIYFIFSFKFIISSPSKSKYKIDKINHQEHFAVYDDLLETFQLVGNQLSKEKLKIATKVSSSLLTHFYPINISLRSNFMLLHYVKSLTLANKTRCMSKRKSENIIRHLATLSSFVDSSIFAVDAMMLRKLLEFLLNVSSLRLLDDFDIIDG